MKRYGYIYEQITDIGNCKLAIYNASKHKKKRPYVANILANIDDYSIQLSNRLQTLDFISPYRIKTIVDGTSKKERTIQIPKFWPDQCAHHAIVQILQPIIEKSSYYWSCANMPNRGVSRAQRGTRKASSLTYCSKLDIRKFYPSINNESLKSFLRTKIKDEKALLLLDTLIDSCEGLPIGNYTSPWLAEWYLQQLDHYIKADLHVAKYIRYADDQVILSNNKKKIHYQMKKISEFTSNNLNLEIKGNYQVFPVKKKSKQEKYGKGRKIDFVGECYAKDHSTIRKRRALALMQQSRQIDRFNGKNYELSNHIASGYISRCSAFKNTNSYCMKEKYGNHINEAKNVVRRNSKNDK